MPHVRSIEDFYRHIASNDLTVSFAKADIFNLKAHGIKPFY